MADISKIRKRVITTSPRPMRPVELKGAEVKSIRAGKVNSGDTFAAVERGQLLLYGLIFNLGDRCTSTYAATTPLAHTRRKSSRLISFLKRITLVCLRLYWKGRKVKAERAGER